MNARPHLLIVDDEPINIQTLYQIFREDCEIFMATSGPQALDMCQNGPLPDLILLDVMMPGMGGHAVCEQLKADPLTADIPVIFVTAQLDPADETLALEMGGVDFITKPVNPAVVRARVRTHLTLKAQSDLLRSLAFVDGLLGIANRRRFDEALHIEWRACRREQKPLTLLMIDIDHFKLYNDHYGHLEGDACLRSVVGAIRPLVYRAHDIFARYGGEEFACLLPGSSLEAGMLKAEELRHAVAALAIPHQASLTSPAVSISIGAASLIPVGEAGTGALVAAADSALYQAKSSGRNRVCAL